MRFMFFSISQQLTLTYCFPLLLVSTPLGMIPANAFIIISLVFHHLYCSVFITCYGRPLSVSGRPCYILPIFYYLFIYFFFMDALFSGPGERRFAKVLHVVDPECRQRSYYLDVFLVILKLQGGPKSDEIWHLFRPRPQTFCSHARTRQNIVILKKNSLSTDGCCRRNATFRELWHTNL